MKMSLKWHRECLYNRLHNLAQQNKVIERLVEDYTRSKHEYEIYAEQILRAEEEGRDGFDADKFNKKVAK